MAVDGDVIIFDEEYTEAGKKIEDYCDYLLKIIQDYRIGIDTILEYSIKDELISEKLRQLVSEVESVKPYIETIRTDAKNACDNYINEIDEQDKFLYGEG